MAKKDLNETTDRRRFLGTLATGAAAVSLATFTPSLNLHAEENFTPSTGPDDPEELFKNLKGKHRAIFDVVEPNQENPMMPFAWARVFLMTNEMTGSKENDVVVVLRHAGIGYAFQDNAWSKYGLGELFKAVDPSTKKAATRNDFWKPAKPYEVPGIGPVPIAINDLQGSGVHFVVCNVAMTVYSAVIAGMKNMKKEDVYNDLKANLLPNVTIVPSGVWAVGRAQENKCAYFYCG